MTTWKIILNNILKTMHYPTATKNRNKSPNFYKIHGMHCIELYTSVCGLGRNLRKIQFPSTAVHGWVYFKQDQYLLHILHSCFRTSLICYGFLLLIPPSDLVIHEKCWVLILGTPSKDNKSSKNEINPRYLKRAKVAPCGWPTTVIHHKADRVQLSYLE